jgi:5-methylthioadenosine/S-adenosylhomocysteine deaminase
MANTSTRTLTCVHMIGGPDGAPTTGRQITVAGDTIASVGAAATAVEPLLALPVLVNAHDHGRAGARVRSALPASRWNPGCIIWR